MDKETVEENVIDIECIDTIDSSNVIVLTDKTEDSGADSYSSIPHDSRLKTGSILAQFFNIIAQVREKEFWQLNTSEINSLNKTCPKILPKIVSDNSGIIGCILSLLGIIVKRLKLEKELSIVQPNAPESPNSGLYPHDDNDEIIEGAILKGSRGG